MLWIAEKILGALGWVLYLLPRPLYALKARGLAWIIAALGLRREVIRANLARAFPGETEAAIAARVKGVYLHLAQLTLEMFFLFGPMRRLTRSRIEWKGVENWRAAVAQGRGAFFLSSHMGNWEIMVCGGGFAQHMDLMMVTKLLKPFWFHRLFERARARCLVAGTYEPKTLRDVLGHLKRGKTVGFVLDQYVGPPIAVRVPFFGVRVGTQPALATLVRRGQTPVVPVTIYRTGRLGDRRYTIEIKPAMPWITGADAADEVLLNTAAYTAEIESHVRAHPEQWLWSHRRFKGLSPGE